MECPKCGHTQPDKTLECERCGIIFSKWREKTSGQKSASIKTVPLSPPPVYRQPSKKTDTIFFAKIAIVIVALAAGGLWARSDLNDWREYSAAEKSFSIQFVGEPVVEFDSQTVEGQFAKVQMETAYYHTAPVFGIPGIEYMVMVADYRIVGGDAIQWDDARAFQGFREGALKKLGWAASVESEQDVSIGGRMGKEWVFKARGGKVTVDVFRSGDRVYAVAIGHPPLLSLTAEKERFFGSFRLL
ncbi:MAG: hypothetical protein HZB29_10895 [Nitrospinae bacterium]|nr:hypothetical protein [Nitrospinota bacterium]